MCVLENAYFMFLRAPSCTPIITPTYLTAVSLLTCLSLPSLLTTHIPTTILTCIFAHCQPTYLGADVDAEEAELEDAMGYACMFPEFLPQEIRLYRGSLRAPERIMQNMESNCFWDLQVHFYSFFEIWIGQKLRF